MKVYEKVAIIPKIFEDSTAYVERAFYYDKDGNVIQTVIKNHLGGLTRISNKYNFIGNILTSQESRQINENAVADIKTTYYTYDYRDRLIGESTQLNDSRVASVQYTYDELGRCSDKIYGDSLLCEKYKYGMTGNLLEQSSNIFINRLNYETPGRYAEQDFTGVVTENTWQYGRKSTMSLTYAYKYTPYGQLNNTNQYRKLTQCDVNTEKILLMIRLEI